MAPPGLDLALRILLVGLAVALVFSLRPLLQALLRTGRDSRRRRALGSDPLAEWRTGHPQVLLFTGAVCSDCVRQKDVLDRLGAAGDGIAVREVNAAGEPELTRRFGIRSVPSTVILDGDGRPSAVNYGLADATILSKQLASHGLNPPLSD
jgi:thiol-disulfide isomerase/thioredoxin